MLINTFSFFCSCGQENLMLTTKKKKEVSSSYSSARLHPLGSFLTVRKSKRKKNFVVTRYAITKLLRSEPVLLLRGWSTWKSPRSKYFLRYKRVFWHDVLLYIVQVLPCVCISKSFFFIAVLLRGDDTKNEDIFSHVSQQRQTDMKRTGLYQCLRPLCFGRQSRCWIA